MRQLSKIHGLLLLSMLSITTSAGAITNYDQTHTSKANTAYNEDINVWVYTSEFADRFGMPDRWIDDSLVGAYAAAYRVMDLPHRLMFPHKGPDVSMPGRTCLLDVFFPADADIPWANDRVRDYRPMWPDPSRYLRPKERSDRVRWVSGFGVLGTRTSNTVVRLFARKQYLGGLPIIRYDKSIYDGIAHIAFRYGCVTPPDYETKIVFLDEKDGSSKNHEYTQRHVIELPASFMRRLYENWLEKSRKPDTGDWKRIIQTPNK